MPLYWLGGRHPSLTAQQFRVSRRFVQLASLKLTTHDHGSLFPFEHPTHSLFRCCYWSEKIADVDGNGDAAEGI
jgi:hypothetical protein